MVCVLRLEGASKQDVCRTSHWFPFAISAFAPSLNCAASFRTLLQVIFNDSYPQIYRLQVSGAAAMLAILPMGVSK